jgi:GT2 family glycosyltransferase
MTGLYRQIAVMSLFRNASNRLTAYMSRIRDLERHFVASAEIGGWSAPSVRVVAVEGDSTDDTEKLLRQYRHVQVVKYNHGGPVFGSTEAPERMKALSGCINAGMDAIRTTDEVVLYVESDLQWDPHSVGSLLDMAWRRQGGFDVFAPVVMAGKNFYDVWGFRGFEAGGDVTRFGPFKPFHSSLAGRKDLTEIWSAGSCLAMRGGVARSTRVRDDNALVGWCAEAHTKGFKVAVAPAFVVRQT